MRELLTSHEDGDGGHEGGQHAAVGHGARVADAVVRPAQLRDVQHAANLLARQVLEQPVERPSVLVPDDARHRLACSNSQTLNYFSRPASHLASIAAALRLEIDRLYRSGSRGPGFFYRHTVCPVIRNKGLPRLPVRITQHTDHRARSIIVSITVERVIYVAAVVYPLFRWRNSHSSLLGRLSA